MRTLKAATIAPALIAGCLLSLLGAPVGRLTLADDISPQQIEQLKKTRETAHAKRVALEKSLRESEERAKALDAKISKLKSELSATKSSLAGAEKELTTHADAVRK